MPHLRGITAHITDSHGENLQEWGTRYLRLQTKGSKVSTYVQSTTDVAFQISLQPDIPFIEHIPPSDASGGKASSSRMKTTRLAAISEDHSTEQDHIKKSKDTLPSPVRSCTVPQSHPPPDFAFLGVLYLDGRRIPERKIIVYTDPADKDFNYPDGKVAFKHRWVQSVDGRMTEHAWVFKEKAIETVFDKLIIAGTQANIENEDDDALIEAMKSSEIDARGKTGKESQVGQIVVELHRVVLGEKRLEAHFRPRHQEGQEEDVDMERAPRDITHATGFIHKKTLKSEPLRVVEHWPYQPNEGPYATFQFFYRSREQLQKFHFPGFVSLPTTTTARTTRLLNTRIADLTPLSISRPLEKKTKKMWCDHDSYEAKIEKRGFRPGGSHKYDFGSEYRDIPAMSPSVGDEACETKISLKYPAAPLPIVANKSVESSHLDAFPLKTSAEAPLLAGNLLAPDPEHKLQDQGRARQTSSLDTPTFITAETSSSAPSLTRFTAEQVTDITDRNRYRPIARDCYPSDREENTDDEHITESDLETHADDDELSYTVGPEDEGYDSLQSQFRDVRIRKRQRDDAEDAEDDNIVCQGAPTAHSDGRREQKTLKLPLTEEERAHRGKKSRTAKQTLVADGGQDAHGTGGVA